MSASNRPKIFNVFKPVELTSYDIIRIFKKSLKKDFGKIGHFGTLDPFASGVLLIGVNGATKLNNYVHKYLTKTYLAIGKLGVYTETGDSTSEVTQRDETPYLKDNIANFSKEFIEEKLKEQFLGVYMQPPHKYSAAKFEGRPMHKWAREGVDIRKEPVERFIHNINVVRYKFPYLSIRVEVSSGTYVRTLFQDFAKHFGTYGTLIGLLREKIGEISYIDSLKRNSWQNLGEKFLDLDQVLKLDKIYLEEERAQRYLNGVPLKLDAADTIEKFNDTIEFSWIYNSNKDLLGMGRVEDEKIITTFNMPR